MSEGTKKLTINGNVNLMTALVAAGYKGTGRLTHLYITNNNDVPLYVAAHNTALTAPGTPTDGTAVGALEDSKQYKVENARIDGHLIWLYAASSIDVKVTVFGWGI